MTAGASQPAGGGIRIAYLTSQYPATSHTFISREVAALRRLGVSVQTFSIRAPAAAEMSDEAVRSESASTYTVLDQPWTSFAGAHIASLAKTPLRYLKTLKRALGHRPPGARGLALSLAHFAEAILLATELKRRGIGRLHNHFANSGATVGYLAAKLLGVPWSFTMHGISETDYPAGLLLADKIRAADFVACVSYFGRAQAMRLVEPEHWDKLHVVRCGLQLNALPKRARNTKQRIVSVGRLSPEKGLAGLFQAFAAVSREKPKFELVLVGDGPERDRLHAIAEQLDIADRVHFAGRCGEADTLEKIGQADILVLASFMEGLPIVIMEAMALGTAVIASRVAGIPELVEDGESGLLFTPSDWDELADCMRRLAGDAGLRKRLATAAREAVAREFDIDRSARQLRLLFTGGDGQ
jgi:glycosyltransferase involved in cell wall biosynthesis